MNDAVFNFFAASITTAEIEAVAAREFSTPNRRAWDKVKRDGMICDAAKMIRAMFDAGFLSGHDLTAATVAKIVNARMARAVEVFGFDDDSLQTAADDCIMFAVWVVIADNSLLGAYNFGQSGRDFSALPAA